jgi:hypothetical protein
MLCPSLQGKRAVRGSRPTEAAASGQDLRRTRCETCLARAEEEARPTDVPLAVGARSRHTEWREGTVHRSETGEVTVPFDAGGYRMLSLDIVCGRGLPEAA